MSDADRSPLFANSAAASKARCAKRAPALAPPHSDIDCASYMPGRPASRTVGTPIISIGKIQIAHHPSNDRQLLKILLAENRRIRCKECEKFRHDRADAAKMSGPRFAAERVREREVSSTTTERSGAYISLLGRPKKKIDAGFRAKFFVIRFGRRISFKIRRRVQIAAG